MFPAHLRSLAVQVGRREVGGLHMGAPANWLPRLMDEYIGFITSERLRSLHPVIQALIAHFFLVTIHPFGDGNGQSIAAPDCRDPSSAWIQRAWRFLCAF